MTASAQLVLSSYTQILQARPVVDPRFWDEVPIPHFQAETLFKLVNEAINVLKQEKTVNYIEGEFIVVGDLHGNLHDLVRILTNFGLPPNTNYLFLGDYVDRGEFSLEVITILYALKIIYPCNIYLIRGNHEERIVNKHYGFFEECTKDYTQELWEHFNVSFEYLPLATVINNQFFCVHGGLSPNLKSFEDLTSIQLPLRELTPLVEDLLWSDPEDAFLMYGGNARGRGCIYGNSAVLMFLKDNNFKSIIRGHQCVMKGVEYSFKRSIVTVFSSSHYSNEHNKCGVLYVSESGFHQRIMPSCERFKRENANFYDVFGSKEISASQSSPKILLNSQKSLSTHILLFPGRNTHKPRRSSVSISSMTEPIPLIIGSPPVRPRMRVSHFCLQ